LTIVWNGLAGSEEKGAKGAFSRILVRVCVAIADEDTKRANTSNSPGM